MARGVRVGIRSASTVPYQNRNAYKRVKCLEPTLPTRFTKDCRQCSEESRIEAFIVRMRIARYYYYYICSPLIILAKAARAHHSKRKGVQPAAGRRR